MVETIKWEDKKLWILDQTKLPFIVEYRECNCVEDVADAIISMQVRGAPAIGVTAAYGMVLACQQAFTMKKDPEQQIQYASELLSKTRPTAVNLFWAIEKMRKCFKQSSKKAFVEEMEQAANTIYKEDIESCRSIGRLGAALLPEKVSILTHCNAGALATAGYGTALGVIRGAVEAGKCVRVFTSETRPCLQGARLTAWELLQDEIDTTLITDNMAAYLMSKGEINAVVVGADRIAANGDTANKIGTYSVALAAAEHSIPFYVAAPVSTIDMDISSGKDIPIEERPSSEVTHIKGIRIAPHGVKIRNPAFDVTPAEFICAIITDQLVINPPFSDNLKLIHRA